MLKQKFYLKLLMSLLLVALAVPQSMADELTVADNGGNTVTSIAPIFGGNYDKTGYVQMLYPSSMLNALNNGQITKITFYDKNDNIQGCTGGVVEVLLGETNAENLASSVNESDLKNLATINGISESYNTTTKLLTITLNKPYVYKGGNLVVEIKVTSKGSSWGRTEFYGQQYTNDMVATSYTIPGTQNYYKKNILPKATFTYEDVHGLEVDPDGGTIAFDETSITGSRTLYIKVINHETTEVTPSFAGLADPFSTSFEGSIEPGEEVYIPIRFAPTEAINYTGSLTMTFQGTELGTYTYTLKGAGFQNQPTMTDNDFAAIKYNWTDSEGTVHENTPMNEVATSAEQMVALMKAVYTNSNVPGNIYRGYTATGEKETDLVSYPAIGTVSSYAYSDSYGWNIPTVEEGTDGLVKVGSSYYLDPTDYVPSKEGLTVLLVEMNDKSVAEAKATEYGLPTTISGNSTYQSTSSYSDLVKKFDVMFKSVRVLTSSKNIGAGEDAGTLFKIDCDNMNRFFLLGKGRLRTYYSNNVKMTDGNGNSYQVMTSEDVNKGPFYQMFEQFSPNVASTGTSAQTDIYQSLVNMDSFGVIHDCVSVPTIDGHHEFNLYGVDSESGDCQDVRDMMFFIPNRRMTDWSDTSLEAGSNKRDNSEIDHYVNYYKENRPRVGLFVIRQFPITGEKKENENKYKLHLTWTSNLLDFLPGEDGKYTLYRVTYVDGVRTYTPVGVIEADAYEYYDEVDMEQSGQQVTYVVRGQDAEEFLSLQYSNEESFIIPGLDKSEQIRLSLNNDYYYSRFYPQKEKNYYSNRLVVNNNIGTNVKADYLEEGSEFIFYRLPNGDASKKIPFATVKVESKADGNGTLSITPNTTGEGVNYWDGVEYKYGYKSMPTQATFTYDVNDGNSDVEFNGLEVYDNFWESVVDNLHPDFYGYYVYLKTAKPFAMGDDYSTSVPVVASWVNGKTFIYVEGYATWTDVKIWAWNSEGNITQGDYPGSTLLTEVGYNGSNKVWLWEVDESVVPTGIKFIWNYGSDQQESGDFNFVNGGYYVASSDSYGYKGTVGSSESRSNVINIPIKKTDMTMKPLTKAQVEGDDNHAQPLTNKFDIDVEHSSKTEILRYDAYRWDSSYGTSNKPFTIIDMSSPVDNEQDVVPNGIAGNQGEYYTIKMNGEDQGTVSVTGTDSQTYYKATFVDDFLTEQTAADTYTYAPVVELFSPAGSDREDYNTYGGACRTAANGVVEVEVPSSADLISTYTWKIGDKRYAYYNVELRVKTNKEIPDGYEVYMVRAWRKVHPSLLDEPLEQFKDRKTETGEYMFEKMYGIQEENGEYQPNSHMTLGAQPIANVTNPNNGSPITVYRGTFGARKVETNTPNVTDANDGCIDQLDMNFIVRIYFTKKTSVNAPKLRDGEEDTRDFYVAEYNYPYSIKSGDIPTAINGVESAKNVAGVKYYNLQGVESDVPFQGVNIEVTTYDDGSRTTRKILK